MPAADLRPCAARRNDAGHHRAGDPAAHKGRAAADSRRNGDEERGRRHNEPSHRFKDCRLPHQARKPHADTPRPQEACTPKGDSNRGDAAGLPAVLHGHLYADTSLQELRRLEGSISQARQVGTGTCVHGFVNDRDAEDAERRGKHRLGKVHQEQLHRLGHSRCKVKDRAAADV